ncbi:MAG: hypothetical protein HYZ00_03415 [Candidatus Hydrogenedentes bacterium]|nr:hypothetical protein [Candidatus Hydrogenedentota bacterium]
MLQWTLEIPESTDRAVRTYLAHAAGESVDLSSFVDEAVRKRVFELAVEQIKERNAEYNPQEILDIIDEAVDWGRLAESQ